MTCQDIQYRINVANVEVGFVQSDSPQCYIRRQKDKHVTDFLTFTYDELEILALVLPKLLSGLSKEEE